MIVGYKEILANLHCEILEINHYNVGGLAYFLYADSRAEFPRLQSFYVPAWICTMWDYRLVLSARCRIWVHRCLI